MNLAFLHKYNDKHVPIRIIGEISCYSFELLDSDDYPEVSVKESEVVFYVDNSYKKSTYFSESINCDLVLNTILSKNQIITIEEPLEINCVFSYSDLKNSDNFTTPVVTFTPLSCDYKELFKLILSVDLLLFFPNDCQLSDISQAAILGINEQISNFKRAYSFLNTDMKCRKIRKLMPFNFQINKDDILTLILPEIEIEKEEIWRKEISNGFNLDKTLQRCQSLYPSNDVLSKLTGNGNKLISPHKKIRVTYPENCLVIGRYTYYHYMQDNFNDKGWGCAYRSLQTIVSWFIWQGWSKIDIPTHKDIQTSLVKIGDKEKSFINSHSWIGSFEISLVLQDLLKIESRIISLNAGSDLVGIYNQLQEHFLECGAPVMIGGGQLAHTIIGISKDSSSKIRFLILDPHFTGSPTDITTILGKGWCGWKELTFWKENVPYNLCLPLLPK